MSANGQKIVERLADQLTGFEDQLRANETGAAALAKIKDSIGVLLDIDVANEQAVRQMLRKQYEQRRLRKNTYRVAVSIVDQIVSARSAAPVSSATEMPAVAEPEIGTEHSFVAAADTSGADHTSTMVLPRVHEPPEQACSQAQSGTVLNDRYQLKNVAARGADGIVFLAYDQQVATVHTDDSRVAVRVLPTSIERVAGIWQAVEPEADRAGELAHPHLVHFVELGQEGGTRFLVTEWIDGRSLADILDSPDARRIDRLSAFRMVRELALALEYLHRCGTVYGDVKPDNIMIAADGSARLMDIVTARIKQEQLAAQMVSGKAAPTYASPQALSGEELAPADDVFSLACLLYRLIAGHRVFGPRNAAEAFEASMQPQRPQGFSDVQWDAIGKALRFGRDERFESIDDFVGALDAVDDLRATIRRMRAPKRRPGGLSATWLVGAIIVAAVSTAGAYKAGWLTESDSSNAITPADRNLLTASPERSSGIQPADRAVGADDREGAEALPASNERIAAIDETLEQQRMEFEALTGTNRRAEVASGTSDSATYSPQLPVNAVGFAEDHIVISESEAAVSVDITRYNADARSITLQYFVNDISATEGLDYFAPRGYSIEFGPRQDTAKILIPLVQDSAAENDESFVIRLMENPAAPAVVERQSIVVTIRDGHPHER